MKITLELSLKMTAYLTELLETEVYGETLQEVVMTLLRDGIVEKISKGIIRRKKTTLKKRRGPL